jgi:hypothetical protein
MIYISFQPRHNLYPLARPQRPVNENATIAGPKEPILTLPPNRLHYYKSIPFLLTSNT